MRSKRAEEGSLEADRVDYFAIRPGSAALILNGAHAASLKKPAPRLLSAARGDSEPARGPVHSPPVVGPLGGNYPLLVIIGPTAAGKSALALELAVRLGGEIVNCDSVQVYRGFDIGAGKTPPQERRGVAHHLLDVAEPEQVFTAGDYRQEALHALSGVRARAKLPILVGGTGLYLRALLLGLFEGPSRSEELRARLGVLAARRGREFLHRLLTRLDRGATARIHPQDTSKTIRALEVRLIVRQPMSVLLERGRAGLQGFRVFKVGLCPERKQLAQRIDARVVRMFAQGLLEETQTMLARPQAGRIKPLGALGYRQACAVLRGELGVEEAIRETQAATRRYAKRQMTWFRRESPTEWFAGFGDNPETQGRVYAWVRQALPALAGSTSPDSRMAASGS